MGKSKVSLSYKTFSRLKFQSRLVIFAGISLISCLLLIGGALIISNQVIRSKDPYPTQASPLLPTPPLKELAEQKGISLGMFASLKYLRERAYREITAAQFNLVVMDGEPNWKFEDHTLRPGPDTFDFTHMDAVAKFADENNMPIRVQHLVWGDEKWLPDWLKQSSYDKEQLLQHMERHIAEVVGRYKGKVTSYSVVNEAFSRQLLTGGNHDWWGERLGTEYIDRAFTAARAADPDAVLLLNDFGNEGIGDISNAMYDYVVDARSRGVPIDAIGMQMHIDAIKAPEKDNVVYNMRRFASIGVPVYVTEFDVNMNTVSESAEKREEMQAKTYADMLTACLEVGPRVCPSFSFLGLIDRQSWYNQIGSTNAYPLMFHDDYTPKPAFFSIRNVLLQ